MCSTLAWFRLMPRRYSERFAAWWPSWCFLQSRRRNPRHRQWTPTRCSHRYVSRVLLGYVGRRTMVRLISAGSRFTRTFKLGALCSYQLCAAVGTTLWMRSAQLTSSRAPKFSRAKRVTPLAFSPSFVLMVRDIPYSPATPPYTLHAKMLADFRPPDQPHNLGMRTKMHQAFATDST